VSSKVAVLQRISDALCFLAVTALLPDLRPSGVVPMLAALTIWAGVLSALRLYRPGQLSPPDALRRLLLAAGGGSGAVLLLGLNGRAPEPLDWPRLTLFLLALEIPTRELWRVAVARIREEGRLRLRTLVVGDELLLVDGRASSWFVTVGTIAGLAPRSWPEWADASGIESTIRASRAECVVVAGEVHPAGLAAVARAVRRTGVRLYLVAASTEFLPGTLAVESVGSLTAISVSQSAPSNVGAAAKRGLDVLVSAAALVALAPLMLVVAAAVVLTSGRPVLFRQARTTRGGRLFTVYKFRSMRLLPPASAESMGGDVPFAKVRDTRHVTPVGRVLRRTSIDELPQLWNVLVGDMSLVGPRPLPLAQVEANPLLLESRHEVRAGLTGWWQINGRSDLSIEESCRLDHFYIQNQSLGLDLYILFRTLGSVVLGKGAY